MPKNTTQEINNYVRDEGSGTRLPIHLTQFPNREKGNWVSNIFTVNRRKPF